HANAAAPPPATFEDHVFGFCIGGEFHPRCLMNAIGAALPLLRLLDAELFERAPDSTDAKLEEFRIMSMTRIVWLGLLAVFAAMTAAAPQAVAQQRAAARIEGQVQVGGGPLANSAVTLWGASAGEPRQLAQTRTGSDGRFQLGSQATIGADVILYVISKGGEAASNRGSGDNPAIAMLAVLGNAPPAKVVINEMTTVA